MKVEGAPYFQCCGRNNIKRLTDSKDMDFAKP